MVRNVEGTKGPFAPKSGFDKPETAGPRTPAGRALRELTDYAEPPNWPAMDARAVAIEREAVTLALTVENIIEAEHLWCVKVDGNYAFAHEPEAHRPQAEHIRAALIDKAVPR
jgi:hypothetical protein